MVRRSRRSPRHSSTLEQLPYRHLRNPYPPVQIASDDEIEAIHQASIGLLRDTGIRFLLPQARDILKNAGALTKAGSERVWFDTDLLMDLVSKAPASFTLHARNPDHSLFMGENAISFSMVASTPNVSCLDKGRRTGNFQDYCNLVKLGQSLNSTHLIAGYPVEPIDLPPATRHLDAIAALATYTDKPLYAYALGDVRIDDGIEIAKIVRGISSDTLSTQPSILTIVNANSPLQYDIPMLQGVLSMVRAGQPVVFTPFTLAGAMAPVTIAGALVQQNAEALAGIAFAQAVNPGTPVMYGSFTSNVDMKSGSPAFGTPEYTKATIISGQLARKYNIPLRASNANASNAPDAQAVYESQMSIWACINGHVNLMMHGLGWLEGGLCASYEKVILDAEMLQMMSEYLQPLSFSKDELAVNAIDEVGPGNHFFQSEHTLERYEKAFYSPLLSDWSNFETWQENGEVTATQRANKIWKQLLGDYQQPEMEKGKVQQLSEYVEMRKREGGAPG